MNERRFQETSAPRPFKFVFRYTFEDGRKYVTPPEDRLDRAGAEALALKCMPNIICGNRAVSLEIVEIDGSESADFYRGEVAPLSAPPQYVPGIPVTREDVDFYLGT